MKKWSIISGATAIILIFVSANAGAMGLGFVLQHESGEIDIEEDSYEWVEYFDEKFDAKRNLLGFTLQSSPIGRDIFNYKFDLGLESVVLDPGYQSWDYEGYGLSMKHAFGFGVARTPAFKFWIGPAMRLYYDYLENEDYYWYDEGDYKMWLFGWGLGPELGFNVRAGGFMVLSFSGGFSYNYIVSAGDYDEYDDYYDWEDESWWGIETMGYLEFSMLFLTGP